MSRQHKFAYFGTPQVARDTLAALLAAGFVPALVVTSPDAPKGRGLALAPTPVRELAEASGIPVLMPAKLDEKALADIIGYGCDYAVVVAYGKIFPDALIGAFPLGALNVHYSLLPKYRGAAPMEGALLAGEKETGVTVQKMAHELDAGDILAQETLPIGADETGRELRPRLIEAGARLLVETLPRFEAGEIVPTPQDPARATHFGKYEKSAGELSLDAPAEENWNKYRAFADTIGTHFFKDGLRVKVTRASLQDGKFVIERVVPEGRQEIDYGEFVAHARGT